MKLQELVNEYGLTKVRKTDWDKESYIKLCQIDDTSMTFIESGDTEYQILPTPTDEGWELYIPGVIND